MWEVEDKKCWMIWKLREFIKLTVEKEFLKISIIICKNEVNSCLTDCLLTEIFKKLNKSFKK
jgi:hypothetical protein